MLLSFLKITLRGFAMIISVSVNIAPLRTELPPTGYSEGKSELKTKITSDFSSSVTGFELIPFSKHRIINWLI